MNIAFRTVLCLIAILIFTLQMTAQSDKFAAFRQTYLKELKEGGIVGSSFVFLKDNKKVAEEYYGLANIEKNQVVDQNTIYHWASNTKPFTGIAIMQLRDRGLLKLDDPVTKYLPELRDVHNKFGSMDEITIRHLMTHSAGFRGSTWPWDKGQDWEPFEPTEYSQLVAMFPFTEILFKPGSKFSYSNPGIIFLGRIIEKLTGDDYEVYIDKNILKPLEMYHSYFDATPYHLLKYRSHSYHLQDGKRTEGRFDANTGITVSNGGLNSPVSDMVKYLNFLVGDPQKQAIYDGVLKRASLEEMWRPGLDAGDGADGNPPGQSRIGLIFFVSEINGHTLIGHSGHQNGFFSYIDVDQKSRTASILVGNTDLSGGNDLQKGLEGRMLKLVRALF
ncbi:MAG: beta-lactamase family protein [Blastocatellia bacterium]|nr:beta-lactamase family protein [Blastocatellia bacterium]